MVLPKLHRKILALFILLITIITEASSNTISFSTANSQLSIIGNPFRYATYYSDIESGMSYCNSRYYFPELLSFTTRDSYPVSNRYNYCWNDPVCNLDPDGHCFECFQGLLSHFRKTPSEKTPLLQGGKPATNYSEDVPVRTEEGLGSQGNPGVVPVEKETTMAPPGKRLPKRMLSDTKYTRRDSMTFIVHQTITRHHQYNAESAETLFTGSQISPELIHGTLGPEIFKNKLMHIFGQSIENGVEIPNINQFLKTSPDRDCIAVFKSNGSCSYAFRHGGKWVYAPNGPFEECIDNKKMIRNCRQCTSATAYFFKENN